ncbi:MAG TPA: hypothetical protein VN690_05025 [Terriglobales bacterium]|nr:hypothetical protein [Terriglobales bacterium]
MTLIVGALCEHGQFGVHASDTRWSAGEPAVQFSDGAHKTYDHNGEVCVGFAGDVGRAETVVSEFLHRCDSLPEKRLERYMTAWQEAYIHAWRHQASGPIQDEVGLTMSEWVGRDLPPETAAAVGRIRRLCRPHVSGLVCGFAGGMGVAFYVNNGEFPREFAAVGFAAIGSGADAAMEEMGRLNQHVHCSLPRTLYNVCLAMDKGAEADPGRISPFGRFALVCSERPVQPLDGRKLREWTRHAQSFGVSLESKNAWENLTRFLGIRPLGNPSPA